MNKIIKKLDQQFIRFLIVGTINTLFGTAIMFIFYNVLMLDYWISSASNYFFGSILSFFLNKYFTFKSKTGGIKQVLYFIINITICYFLAYGIAKPIVKSLMIGYSTKIQDNVAMMVGMVLFVILNYMGQNLVVFNKKNH